MSNKYKVLIVDDSYVYRNKIAKILEEKGEIVCEKVANGMGAIKILSSDASYDLVTIDYNMPGLNGLDTVEKINQLNLDINILIITAGNRDIVMDALELGVDEFLFKPVEKEKLRTKIMSMLENKENIL